MEADGEDYEIIDLQEHRNEVLLERFSTELYLPAFPIAEERTDPAVWPYVLWERVREATSPRLHFFILGRGLADPHHCELAGGHIFSYYVRSSCALLAYLVVSPDNRGNGLARLLVDAAYAALEKDASTMGKNLKAVFAEVNNPAFIAPEQDSISPSDRLRIFDRIGSYVIDIPYVQPELRPGLGRPRGMFLMLFDHERRQPASIPTDTVMSFLHEYYSVLGVRNLDDDADFREMSEYTRAKGDTLSLASPSLFAV